MKGLGTDIIEIARIRLAVDRYGARFLERIYTERERSYCLSLNDPIPSLAARFAGKEAVFKAFGTGLGSYSWHDVEITKDHLGKPQVSLSEKLRKKFPEEQLFLSLSHCREYAVATAIREEINGKA